MYSEGLIHRIAQRVPKKLRDIYRDLNNLLENAPYSLRNKIYNFLEKVKYCAYIGKVLFPSEIYKIRIKHGGGNCTYNGILLKRCESIGTMTLVVISNCATYAISNNGVIKRVRNNIDELNYTEGDCEKILVAILIKDSKEEPETVVFYDDSFFIVIEEECGVELDIIKLTQDTPSPVFPVENYEESIYREGYLNEWDF